MTSRAIPMCYACIHLRPGTDMTCDAFPAGIPDPILDSVVDHRTDYQDDNGIVFEQNPDVPTPQWEMYEFGSTPPEPPSETATSDTGPPAQYTE